MFAFGNYGKGLKGLYSFSFGPELTCTSAGKLLVPEHCTWGTWDMRQGNLSLHRWNDQDRASKVWRQAVKTLSWHSFPILLGGNTFFFLLFSAINMLLRRCMEQLVQTVDRLWLRPGFVVKHSLCFSSTCQESSRPRYFRHSLQWWRDWAVWQSFKNKQTSCAYFPNFAQRARQGETTKSDLQRTECRSILHGPTNSGGDDSNVWAHLLVIRLKTFQQFSWYLLEKYPKYTRVLLHFVQKNHGWCCRRVALCEHDISLWSGKTSCQSLYLLQSLGWNGETFRSGWSSWHVGTLENTQKMNPLWPNYSLDTMGFLKYINHHNFWTKEEVEEEERRSGWQLVGRGITENIPYEQSKIPRFFTKFYGEPPGIMIVQKPLIFQDTIYNTDDTPLRLILLQFSQRRP